jgi:hypothetical protein
MMRSEMRAHHVSFSKKGSRPTLRPPPLIPRAKYTSERVAVARHPAGHT